MLANYDINSSASSICLSIYTIIGLAIFALAVIIIGVFLRHSEKSVARLLCISGTGVFCASLFIIYLGFLIEKNITEYLFHGSLMIDKRSIIIVGIFLFVWAISMIAFASWFKSKIDFSQYFQQLKSNTKKSDNYIQENKKNICYIDNSNEKLKRIPFEISGMLIFSAFALCLLILANDLPITYIALEISALSLYPIIACYNDSTNNTKQRLEGAVKYFIFNGVMSSIFLMGSALIYISTKTLNFSEIFNDNIAFSLLNNNYFNNITPNTIENTDINSNFESLSHIGPMKYIFIIGSILLIISIIGKIGSAPFHFWIPDIYQSAPTFIIIFIGGAKKIGMMMIIYKMLTISFSNVSDIVNISAIISLLVGAFGGLMQTNIKRLIGFSSISHIGFMLLGLIGGFSVMMQYTIVYSLLLILPFLCIFLLLSSKNYNINISDLNGLSKKHPYIAAGIAICILSMASLPPFCGFFIKFDIIKALLNQNMIIFAIIAIISSILSIVYYLRIIVAMYFMDDNNQGLYVQKTDNINQTTNDDSLMHRFLLKNIIFIALFLNICYFFLHDYLLLILI